MQKHILCFGDSNTHGFVGDLSDCKHPEFGRFDETERWTCLLQEKLGSAYRIIEEGLGGRTTVFDDPLSEGLSGLHYIAPCLRTHKPICLVVLMLGTNDVKERFSMSAPCIGLGLERLGRKIEHYLDDFDEKVQILIVSPPAIRAGIYDTPFGETMGAGCVEKSQKLGEVYRDVAQRNGWHFLDAETFGCQFNTVDFMHLTPHDHTLMAEHLAPFIQKLEL